MALAVANDGCRMTSESLNINSSFSSITQRAATSLSPAQPYGIQPTRPLGRSDHCIIHQGDADNKNEHDVKAQHAHKSVNASMVQAPSELVLRLSPSRRSTCGKQCTLSSTNMSSDLPKPASKRQKVTPEPEALQTMKQGTLPWNQPGAQRSIGEHIVMSSYAEGVSSLPEVACTDLRSELSSDKNVLEKRPVTPPKKFMKLRTDGKLFSPSKKENPTEFVKRGRNPRNSKEKRLVVMRYGTDDASRRELGERIQNILNGTLRIRSSSKPIPQESVESVKITSATPTKRSTHPFFSGKPKTLLHDLRPPSPPVSIGSTSRSSSPHKLPSRGTPKPLIGMLFGGSAAKIVYPPNTNEPLWPPEGLVHTRDIPPSIRLDEQAAHRSFGTIDQKSKESQVLMESSEEILSVLKETINNSGLAEQVRHDGAIKAPKRHIVLRSELPALVSRQLTQETSIGRENEEYTQHLDSNNQGFTSVAAQLLFDSLSTANSAFDRFRCENQQWIVKYSPKSTVEILQPQEQMQSLKTWLSGSAVHSTTNVDIASAKQKHKSLKKRKQVSELDDFIVTSDDDDSTELSDACQLSRPSMSRFRFHKTAMRPAKHSPFRNFTLQTSRQTKAVILSGPPGCGKTAAVYAIAQDLGFEIFEINPGTRRSGRDVLEKVGDMTRNHLVNQDSNHSKEDERSADEHAPDVSNVHEEIANGKQSTMQSFFQAKSFPKAVKTKPIKPLEASHVKLDSKQEQRKANKPQKQSLILLEEVDILFEEDKQFWNTVVALIATSKRPIIMTCNDESLLPSEDIEGCSILRMNPCSEIMVIDYLLLIAAHEGHLLERSAISTLYAQNKSDLRASIMQLNLWCQMAINDPTGGLSWMLLPQDFQGTEAQISERRILSEGTFLPYMGTMGVNESSLSMAGEFDLRRWSHATYEWELDAEDLISTFVRPTHNAESSREMLTGQLVLSDLACDALSACDVQNRAVLNSRSGGSLFVSPLPDQRRSDSFTVSPPLLQVCPDGVLLDASFDIGAFLSHHALLARGNYAENSTDSFGYNTLCQSIIDRKAPLSAHCQFIEETTYAAFDPIVDYSDQNIKSIFSDSAPYVRSIISYDLRLKQDRARLNNLLSDGSRQGKRQRTTRASRAALEGGHKSNTRREHWFEVDLDSSLVLETGGQDWQAIAWTGYERAVRRWKWAQKTEQSDSEDELCQ